MSFSVGRRHDRLLLLAGWRHTHLIIRQVVRRALKIMHTPPAAPDQFIFHHVKNGKSRSNGAHCKSHLHEPRPSLIENAVEWWNDGEPPALSIM
jgi:hypothetical protein